MEEFQRNLARITKAELVLDMDIGGLTFWIDVDYEDGLSQTIGGYTLDEYDSVTKTRIGTAYGTEMIRQVLIALNVQSFNELKDRDIFVLCTEEGFNKSVKGLQALRADGGKKVIFRDIFERFNAYYNSSLAGILEVLRKHNSKQYKRLQRLLNRGITITPFQANLAFLKRGYGKSFISRCVVASDMLDLFEKQEFVSIGINDEDIIISEQTDKDIRTRNQFEYWFDEYYSFLQKYFSDFIILRKNKTTIIVQKDFR